MAKATPIFWKLSNCELNFFSIASRHIKSSSFFSKKRNNGTLENAKIIQNHLDYFSTIFFEIPCLNSFNTNCGIGPITTCGFNALTFCWTSSYALRSKDQVLFSLSAIQIEKILKIKLKKVCNSTTYCRNVLESF